MPHTTVTAAPNRNMTHPSLPKLNGTYPDRHPLPVPNATHTAATHITLHDRDCLTKPQRTSTGHDLPCLNCHAVTFLSATQHTSTGNALPKLPYRSRHRRTRLYHSMTARPHITRPYITLPTLTRIALTATIRQFQHETFRKFRISPVSTLQHLRNNHRPE